MSGTPRFAQIEPTTRCNYTCGFCAGRTMRQGDLPWRVFERFLADNPALERVELQGEGEPLLHPRFFDMVAACRARGLTVSLISNGSLLGRENVDKLILAGVSSIHISLESADPTTFQAIRGGKLLKVVAGLETLMRRRHAFGRDRPFVGLCVTLLRRTLQDIDGIVALYNELGLDGGISLQLLQQIPCYAERYDDAMRREVVPDDLWRAHRARVDHAVAQAPARADMRWYYGALFEHYEPTAGRCPWLDNGAYLDIEGGVTGCCFMKRPEHVFGNVMIDTPVAIARQRTALADALQAGTVPAACGGCRVAAAAAARRRPAAAD